MSQFGAFPTTQWTGVRDAGIGGTAGAEALARLLPRYLRPLRAHLVLQRKLPADQADDLIQSFLAEKVLERNLVGGAVPGKGRFRTFLLVALNRFVSNQLRNERCAKRSHENGEASAAVEHAADDAPGPAEIFQIAWARQVLADAAQLMRRQCHHDQRNDIWAVFEARVLGPSLEGAEPVAYEELAGSLGLSGVEAARNLLVTGKRMFARSVRGVVREYTGDDAQVDQEIAELRQVLAGARA
jgi:RNA polymerase sigma-70 factor (ECF subfamily)